MKKTSVVLFALIFITQFSFSQQWHKVPGKISSPWSEKVDPDHPLPEYPRPQMERGSWVNLNGLWNYSVTVKDAQNASSWNGKILVPFAIESSMSGVGRLVGKDSTLWYNRKFSLAKEMKGKRILLHFGAVDWRTKVYVNNKEAGMHEGGFDPFTIDITSLIRKTGEQDVTVSVWDPTDEGPQPRGKQVKDPEGIWYTPVTGIWQTVWIEAVADSYITTIKPTPDIDNQSIAIIADAANAKDGDKLMISAWDGSAKIAEATTTPGQPAALKIENVKLWSPDDPFLYNLKIALTRNGKKIDEVKSYFAMRKSSVGTDENGIRRMLLNNKFTFQFGPLDQGWWPDGLYTAPSEEALIYDIDKTKEMGFNMIRKHIKVEPARWYYHCDKVGMLIWQDMPSGDLGNRWDSRPAVDGKANDKKRTEASENYYKKDWNNIIDALYPFPSIVVWIPFNEGWGQFKTPEIAAWTREKDPSRLVNSASGGNFSYVDHIIDIHNYPEPVMPSPEIFGKKLALVLGEFGGLGLPVSGHVWQEKDNWGYQSFKTADELFSKYSLFIDTVDQLITKGLSAAVYTQTTDVEVEVNGLMTYDRKVIKNDPAKFKALHHKLYLHKINVHQ
ncbi:MAG TPA: glycoside hydrolase family 2 TIM barrel-domain containing protein [Flavitalea sp.]|nr:glycoside hydrolase family 2 TIM barrel-domain containing protein [Flavitalea sp.]